MRLRRSIRAPERYEGADKFVPKKHKRDPTQPAYPELMARHVVAFDPAARPAVFPSLPFKQYSSLLDPDFQLRLETLDSLSVNESQQEFHHNVVTYGDIDQQRYSNKIDWHKSNDLVGIHNPKLETTAVHYLQSDTDGPSYHFPQDIFNEMRSSPEPEDDGSANAVSASSYL